MTRAARGIAKARTVQREGATMRRHNQGLVLLFASIFAAVAMGCGARTSEEGTSNPDDASAPSIDAGYDARSSGDGASDAGEDAAPDAGPSLCQYCCNLPTWGVTIDGGLDAASTTLSSGQGFLPADVCEADCPLGGHEPTPYCALIDAAAPASIHCTAECMQ